jgi:tRNA(fMet)-specific endonuclease VapC
MPLLTAPVTVAFATVAELHFGAISRSWGPTRIRQLEAELAAVGVLVPDEESARLCGELRAEAQRLGHPLGHKANANDLWIATCAIHAEAPLVTGNFRHFEGFPGLTVLSPDAVR